MYKNDYRAIVKSIAGPGAVKSRFKKMMCDFDNYLQNSFQPSLLIFQPLLQIMNKDIFYGFLR